MTRIIRGSMTLTNLPTPATLPMMVRQACTICFSRVNRHHYWAGSANAGPCQTCPSDDCCNHQQQHQQQQQQKHHKAIASPPSCFATVPEEQHISSELLAACEACQLDGPICKCGAHWRTHVGKVMWQCGSGPRCRGTRFYHEACLSMYERRPRITNEGFMCRLCYHDRAGLCDEEEAEEEEEMGEEEVEKDGGCYDDGDEQRCEEMEESVTDEESGMDESVTLVGDSDGDDELHQAVKMEYSIEDNESGMDESEVLVDDGEEEIWVDRDYSVDVCEALCYDD